MSIDIASYVSRWKNSPWKEFTSPWELTARAELVIAEYIKRLGDDYEIIDGIAKHKTSVIEGGAIIKPPCIIGPNCFLAHHSYLRGGVWLAENVIIGPSCEVKTSLFFPNSKVAHLSFVGDSIIGSDANIEAGAMIANYRNERNDKRIRIAVDGAIVDAGVDKFGALMGDGARIGANAVIAPGAILRPGKIVRRLELVDQAVSQ